MNNNDTLNDNDFTDELPAPIRIAVETILAEPVPDFDLTRPSLDRSVFIAHQPTRRDWWARAGSGLVLAATAAALLFSLVAFRPASVSAQVVEAIRKQAWVHFVMTAPGSNVRAESWFSPTKNLAAVRLPGKMSFFDGNKNVLQRYDEKEKAIYVSEPISGEREALLVFDAILQTVTSGNDAKKKDDDAGGIKLVAQSKREMREGNERWTDYVFEFEHSRRMPPRYRQVLRVPAGQQLPIRVVIEDFTANGKAISRSFDIDYPAAGPIDLYAMDVPKDAKIIQVEAKTKQSSPKPLKTEPPVPQGEPVKPRPAPKTVEDLRALEEQFQQVAVRVQPAVVAVRNPTSAGRDQAGQTIGASGVIINSDGLVLSSWHVSHARRSNVVNDTFQPGEKTKVILHDGRECVAELLGSFPKYDSSLLRIVSPGPFPHVPLKPTRVAVGDWVLKVGHPGGYRRDRPAPVRSGRVLAKLGDEGFFADCIQRSGDSGGPYFDLDGNLVGIIHGGTPDLGFLLPDDEAIAQRCGGGVSTALYSAVAAPLIHGLLDEMQHQESTPTGPHDFNLNNRMAPPRTAARVPAAVCSQGPDVLAAYEQAIHDTAPSVVAILNGQFPVALGTAVGPNLVVTKASELPPQPSCRLPTGTVVTPRIVGVELSFDVALLEVQPSSELRPVIWADKCDPPLGTLLAAVGPNAKPLAAGIVSVGRRDSPAKPSKEKLPLRVPANRPEVMLWVKSGGERVIDRITFSCGLALAAGIHRGDSIQSLDGQDVRTSIDFTKSLEGHLSGDSVSVGLLRDGKQVELNLPLSAGPYRGVNFRSDGFPTAFEHGIPVMANECGGPLVDLSGRVVGITIARVGHGCLAIPGDCIERLLPELHSGKLAKNWKWPRNDDK